MKVSFYVLYFIAIQTQIYLCFGNVTLTVSLSVGTPQQNVTMVLDTGSELSWLQCNNFGLARPMFDPTQSSTYKPVNCSSPTCTTQTRDFPIPTSCDFNKHQIIGNQTKKLIYIKLGAVPFFVEILCSAAFDISGDVNTVLVQSCVVLGSFACGVDPGVKAVDFDVLLKCWVNLEMLNSSINSYLFCSPGIIQTNQSIIK
ncbi:hypothetical protein POM88_012151 [Heracleum sosnowskyi]|uniref:Peptidase A1 domain-containing protein n=1 Tax=Heracleum sosnowskyi TaxID=360622 RepID=A0AAD8IW70_9APIA|nr:hypothetical protein POM88_012151 [Heracleum sosnowskyi]